MTSVGLGIFWLINQNIPNPTEVIFFSYGTAGDVPIVGNWDAL